MSITVHNSLTNQKEAFKPLVPDNVRLYVCGPTVYDRAHIGNARAVVVFDMWFRVLRQHYGPDNVVYARNITDVDDKINAAAKERGIDISELTVETTKIFHQDMAKLNCLAPNIEPRATEHIGEMIAMVESLIAKNHAYEAKAHVLFDVQSFDEYGKLSRRSRDEMIAGARVEVAPFKRDPADFVLWKPSNHDEPGWDSPWGRGRPGWHLECSAMSTKYLGVTFDIHGGGADLKFPHHENEIAQSRCTHEHGEFAKYWLHNGFLSVEGEKMSKSLGNFITVEDLMAQGHHGEVVRYALLASHYRRPLDWTKKALHDAKKAMDSFYNALRVTDDHAQPAEAEAPQDIVNALYDDLNTPKALALLHSLATKANKAKADEQVALCYALKKAGMLMGLCEQSPAEWFAGDVKGEDAVHIVQLIDQRNAARQAKNWAESDRIRDELTAMGVKLEDKPDGTTSWRRG